MALETIYKRNVSYHWLASAVIGINGFVQPLLQINIRLRNVFKFNLYHTQGTFKGQQFDYMLFVLFFQEKGFDISCKLSPH